jgi:hypothetical protein
VTLVEAFAGAGFPCAGGAGGGDWLGLGFGEVLGGLGRPPGRVATGNATPARTGIGRAAASVWTVWSSDLGRPAPVSTQQQQQARHTGMHEGQICCWGLRSSKGAGEAGAWSSAAEQQQTDLASSPGRCVPWKLVIRTFSVTQRPCGQATAAERQRQRQERQQSGRSHRCKRSRSLLTVP